LLIQLDNLSENQYGIYEIVPSSYELVQFHNNHICRFNIDNTSQMIHRLSASDRKNVDYTSCLDKG